MQWFKVDSDIATNPKIDQLSDGAFRALTHLWGHAMQHETGGRITPAVTRLVPRVTPARVRELEEKGFLHKLGDEWRLHDWEEHQAEAIRVHEKRRIDAERKREKRAQEAAHA